MASSSSSTLVIKVNYGDIMRRFSAQIINGRLSLTLNELRRKILSLFGFPLDKSIMVHYIDEDGDMVTLADCVDLCDVVKQGLNPLRLTFGLIYDGSQFDDGLTWEQPLADHLYTKLKLSDDRLVQPQPAQKTKNSGHSQSEKVMNSNPVENNKNVVPNHPYMGGDRASAFMDLRMWDKLNCPRYSNDFCYVPFGSNPVAPTIEFGVSCSNCGIKPITGPAYESKLKLNYILCNVCFQLYGKGMDYTRMDTPEYLFPEARTASSRASKAKSSALELDSSFVKDVNVVDGSILPPLTACTKLWRMRNTGSIPWPQKTRLVWVGGCKLSNQPVKLEIPASGLSVGHELNVAVNFVSPSNPGEYTSFWRMSLPSGKEFGPEIWVHFKVDKSINDLPSGYSSPGITSAQAEPIVGVSQKRDGVVNVDQEKINHGFLFGNRGSSSVPPAGPSTPKPNTRATPVSWESSELDPPEKKASNGASSSANPDIQKLEELNLKLEEMGYKDFNLNMEILMKHNYGWDETLEELSRVAKWDPMLEELDKMGFMNAELNTKLLKKNNGSIKRVVMDLLTGKYD